MSLNGYRTEQLLWKNQGEAVYVASRLGDGLPVTAKVYDRELYERAPAAFEYEYSAFCDSTCAGLAAALARVDLEEHRALIFARPAGAPLLDGVHGPVELPRLLDFACQMTSALAVLHGRRLTHRHLRPDALTLDAASGRLVLTDLGFSLGQDRAARDLQGPAVLEGSLPYLSPEQTGRIARSFDRRSDLYSLGAILYQLATGRPPFKGKDAMELIHAHLALRPVPIARERRDIPLVLSDIIDRLLAKDASERYQSAEGLLADLEKSRAGVERGRVERFELGVEDNSETFEFPERLYGRDTEVADLQSALQAARAGGSSVLLISGPPGIGKTALVEGARAALLAQGGSFAVGKFDLTRQGTPFLAPAQAVAGLVDALITLPEQELAVCRKRLLETLDGLGPVLFEFAPALHALLGEQTSLPLAGSLEAKHRLVLAFQHFFRAVVSPERPLLLFIDDLQWSDPGSVDVWEQLALDGRIAGLVLVGAYRTHELDAEHPLERAIERLEAQGVPLQRLQLGALSPQATASLIMDALRVERERADELGRLLAQRTEHNPLVIRQLLLFMAERRVLTRQARGWQWSNERLLDVGLPESLMDVIHIKIAGLAPEPRAALLAASCLGSPFDTESLAAALDRDPLTVLGLLAVLREQGLLVEAGGKYHFEHDGVLEAASSRLTQADRYAHHVRAGRFRRARADGESLALQVFTIVGHLNRTILDEQDGERLMDLARLNLLAGTKAARAAAYRSALEYLAAGLSALERHTGLNGAEEVLLSSALQLELARAMAFSGDHAASNRLFDELLARPLPSLRRAQICSSRVEVSLAAGQFEEAVRWGLSGLAYTGLRLPRHPSKASLLRELLRMGWMARGDIGRRILALPECEDPNIQIRIELLSILSIAVIRLGGELVPLLFLAGARETFRHGKTPASPHALTAFGTLLVGVFGKFTTASQLADAALVLARAPDTRHRSNVLLASHSMLLPWTRPWEACVEELAKVHAVASLEGDFMFAGYGLVFVANCYMAMGVPLDRLRRAAERARGYLATTATAGVTAGQEVLVGIADGLGGASEASFDTDDPFGALSNADLSVRCPSLVFSSALHCVTGQPERALRLIETIESVAEVTLLAVAERAEYYFWRALAAGMASERQGWKRSPNRRRLWQGLRQFRRWARLCNENFGSKALLLEAEWTRLGASPEHAAPLYARAAALAEQHGRLQVAALAYERLARTGVSSGPALGRVAKLAVDAYVHWGADRKAAWLAAEFRSALATQQPALSLSVPPVRQPGPVFSQVDLASVLKTTRAITAAPDYESVVERLMAGLIENAGAQRGVLLMQGPEGWTVEMAYGADGPEPGATGVPLRAARELVPVGMLSLVERKQSPFIYDAGRDGGLLARDPYISSRRVRAAMCVPIELQGRSIGAIYLENKLSPGVFTPERIEMVVALAAQAAISLTNARLLGALRASEAEWRSLVDHAPDVIMIVNREHAVEFMNRAPLGMDEGSLLGARVDSFLSATGRGSLAEAIDSVFERGGHASCDTQYTTSYRRRLLVTRISPIAIDGKVTRVTLLSTDVTDRRALEDHLSQTQKLEAIGTLAGGVAHDFNNLLSVIVGSCEVGLRSCSSESPHQQRYEAILATTTRATSLTRQLLTFSRKGSIDIEELSLNQVVEHSCKMLERLLGADVQIERVLSPGMGSVAMNRCQLEQVLLNLSINARDAMPGGGRLTFRTRELDIDPGASNASLTSGRYACLSVTDTGCGMDEATRQRVFEPFFTTKAVGRGTGLGLATLHGIVHRAGGSVSVTSTLGAGSTFEIVLPICEMPAREQAPVARVPELPRGSETILLVEDNHEVRALTAAMLEGQGYRVISAASGNAALLDHAAIDAADLLFTDIVMPGLKGPELAREVLRRKPQIKLLYSSGRGLDVGLGQGPEGRGEVPFLAKPYSLAQLAHTVRTLLDQTRGDASRGD